MEKMVTILANAKSTDGSGITMFQIGSEFASCLKSRGGLVGFFKALNEAKTTQEILYPRGLDPLFPNESRGKRVTFVGPSKIMDLIKIDHGNRDSKSFCPLGHALACLIYLFVTFHDGQVWLQVEDPEKNKQDHQQQKSQQDRQKNSSSSALRTTKKRLTTGVLRAMVKLPCVLATVHGTRTVDGFVWPFSREIGDLTVISPENRLSEETQARFLQDLFKVFFGDQLRPNDELYTFFHIMRKNGQKEPWVSKALDHSIHTVHIVLPFTALGETDPSSPRTIAFLDEILYLQHSRGTKIARIVF